MEEFVDCHTVSSPDKPLLHEKQASKPFSEEEFTTLFGKMSMPTGTSVL